MSENANTAIYTAGQAKEKFDAFMARAADVRTTRIHPSAGKQIIDFADWLCRCSTWLSSPASSKFHLCVENGLLIHSVVVTEKAVAIRDAIMPGLALDSVILCAMFHDLGKVWGTIGTRDTLRAFVSSTESCVTPYYVEKFKKDKTPAAQRYQVENQLGRCSVPVNSVRLVERYIDLTDAEAQAIVAHDGQYVPGNREYQHREHPLTLITHMADMWTGHVVEGNIAPDENNKNTLFLGEL